MFTSTGTLVYSENPYKLIVSVDDNIGRYYYSLIPKYVYARIQMYPSHISVVRKEIPKNLSAWRKYQDQEIAFEYEPMIYNDNTYYWLNAYSSVLENIRLELGLPSLSKYTKSPDGRHKFHITIGNTK